MTASLANIVLSYLPGLFRLAVATLRTPARVIFAENTVVIPLAILHRLRWRSRLIFDARERPKGIRTKGSIASWISRIEGPYYRLTSPFFSLCTTVSESHAQELRKLGFKKTLVIRNVPEIDERPWIDAPAPSPFKLAYVGSLYSGRGIEELIGAIGKLREKGIAVELSITGWGAAEYLNSIERQIEGAALKDVVKLLPPCEHHEVMRRYQDAHAGCALYAPVDVANDSLSNKLFESIAAGRAVLACDLPQTKAIIDEFRCGVTSRVEVEPLADAIEAMIDEGAAHLGRAAHEAFLTELNWDAEIKPLEKELENWGVGKIFPQDKTSRYRPD